VETLTAAAVAAHMGLDPADEKILDRLAGPVAAVNVLVPRMATTPAEAQAYGAKLLAARLDRRRNSPEGVATFTAEGAVYVQRNDPDIAMTLGIGSWAPPVVG
jgi:hypothetical protein